MNSEIKHKLENLDKLFYIIDDKQRYILTGRNGRKETSEFIVDYDRITNYFYDMQELSNNKPWDTFTERKLYDYYMDILSLSSISTITNKESFNIINNFKENQLMQLNKQLDLYIELKKLYSKFKK
ncbi:MAG: hypothetical protein BWY15_01612 [Firmicutes bacterium ADurb.Bin193]|nr:MAG: hypothetical protein BWY15_01612 [Firmicutes bacterium ADurb.Bin193]